MDKGFRLRSWRRTSERICASDSFPPGFRIVLVSPSGRARSDSIKVRSGDLDGSHPNGFTVGTFLNAVMQDSIDQTSPLVRASRLELRDDKNKRVDEHLTLRRVRDMPGLDGSRAQDIEDSEIDVLPDLKDDIAEALELMDPQFDYRLAYNDELMLKALFNYMLGRFEADAINHVIELNRRRLDRPD